MLSVWSGMEQDLVRQMMNEILHTCIHFDMF